MIVLMPMAFLIWMQLGIVFNPPRKGIKREVIMKLYKVVIENHSEEYRPEFTFREFDVISETEKTYLIETKGYNKIARNYIPVKRRVLKDQRGKRYAYATKENAIRAFVFKRLRYKSILNWQLSRNDLVIEIAKKMELDINYKHDFEIYF